MRNKHVERRDEACYATERRILRFGRRRSTSLTNSLSSMTQNGFLLMPFNCRDARLFLVVCNALGIFGTSPAAGTRYGLPLFPLLILSSLQLSIALRLSTARRKDLLAVTEPWSGRIRPNCTPLLAPSSLATASNAHWSAISLPVTPAWPGTQWTEISAVVLRDSAKYIYSCSKVCFDFFLGFFQTGSHH